MRYSSESTPASLVDYLNVLRVTKCTVCQCDGIKEFKPTPKPGRFVGKCLVGEEKVGLLVVDFPGWCDTVASNPLTTSLLGGLSGIVVVVDPAAPHTFDTVRQVALAAIAAKDRESGRPADIPFLSVCWSKTDVLPDDSDVLLSEARRAVHAMVSQIQEYGEDAGGDLTGRFEVAEVMPSLPDDKSHGSSAAPPLGRGIRPIVEYM